MKNVTMNTNRKKAKQGIDRHALAPSPGDTVVTDDGREGIVTKISWRAKESILVKATVYTETFECDLGEVATITKPEPPAEE